MKKLRVTRPCPKRWSELSPQSNGRHCFDCQKAVFDAAAMTSEELDCLIRNEKNPCMRLATLSDGTVLTRDRIRIVSAVRPPQLLVAAIAAAAMACNDAPERATGESPPSTSSSACTEPAPPEAVARVAGTTKPVELTREQLDALASLGYVE
jgi:hypothetical protein